MVLRNIRLSRLVRYLLARKKLYPSRFKSAAGGANGLKRATVLAGPCYSRRSCSSMDPDLEGIAASVGPVDCADDSFLDNDFIDRFCDLLLF